MSPPTGSVLAIDPGIRGCGVAFFDDGRLVRACYIANPSRKGNGPGVAGTLAREVARTFAHSLISTVVVEFPQVYRAAQQKGDPNDLLGLAAIDGALGALYPLCVHYLPHQWKGQLPADHVVEGRCLLRLSEAERGRIALPGVTLAHNVWDAIGIGLFHLGRFAPVRVITN